MSYDCRELDRFTESEFWADWTFFPGEEWWMNQNTKVAINELSFPLVTYMAHSDAWFDSDGILMSGRGAKNFLDRLGRPANNRVLGQKMHKTW
jgi:hypothetical protein